MESLFKKGDLDGNGKPTEKVNGLEVSKVKFINKIEGFQKNSILCLKQV